MSGTKEVRTRQLSCGQFEIIPSGKRSRPWLAVVLLLGMAGAYAAWRVQHTSPEGLLSAELQRLGEQNKSLQAELEQLRMSVSHGEATRKELQSQLDERSAQIKKLQEDISFFRSQRASAASAASGPSAAR